MHDFLGAMGFQISNRHQLNTMKQAFCRAHLIFKKGCINLAPAAGNRATAFHLEVM